MGLRLQKRINLGKGVGINISKSGVSGSLKTKFGSVGTKGYSIRTGIPGLSYRGGKNDKAAGVMLLVGIVIALVTYVPWVLGKIYAYFARLKKRKQASDFDRLDPT